MESGMNAGAEAKISEATRGEEEEESGAETGGMEVDEALSRLGRFGRWQVSRYCLLCTTCLFTLALHVMIFIFMGQEYDFRCKDSQLAGESLQANTSTAWGRCTFRINGTNQTASCRSGWEYRKPETAESIVTEFNLVCYRSYLVSMSQTIFTVGMFISNLYISALSDRFGRKRVLLTFGILLHCVAFANAFAPDYLTFLILRFFVGLLVDGTVATSFVFTCEHFPHQYRNLAIAVFLTPWIPGVALLTAVSLFLQNWRHLQIAMTLPGVVFIIGLWYLDESVPWLAASGKTERAEEILRKAARLNGITGVSFKLKPTPCSKKQSIKSNDWMNLNGSTNITSNQKDLEVELTENLSAEVRESGTDQNRDNLLSVLKHRRLRGRLILLSAINAANNIVYYGIVLGVSDLMGDLHMNVVVLMATDVGNVLFLIGCSVRWGRKVLLCGGLIVAGLCLIASTFIPEKTSNGTPLGALVTTVIMIGKVGIGLSFNTTGLYSPEAFPTQVRNLSFGIILTLGRFGAIVAPFYPYLVRRYSYVPAVTCGTMAALLGFLVLRLPETRHQPLFQTIREMDAWSAAEKERKSRNKWKARHI